MHVNIESFFACTQEHIFVIVNSLSFNLSPVPAITVSVTPNLNTPAQMIGTGSILTCGVSGADNLDPTTTYRWTRDGGREISRLNTLPLSPVGLSDAGNYTCHATVNSNLLRNGITVSANQIVMVQGELVAYCLSTYYHYKLMVCFNSPSPALCYCLQQYWQ